MEEDPTATVLAELSEKSDEELRTILDRLDQEEQELSYKRRTLHAKIDILRAEVTARLKEKHGRGESVINGRDLDRLSEILARDLIREKADPK